MRNRQPTPGYEGRVLITPEDGSPAFYAKLEMADKPLDPGTPWAKETVLRDETAEILGLDTDAVPDDAFLAVLLQSRQLALVEVTVTVNGQTAIAGIEILNLTTLSGDRVYTDGHGKAVVYAPAGRITISTPVYEDLPASNSVALDIVVGQKFSVTLNVAGNPTAGTKTLNTSKSGIRFSPYVTGVDSCLVGAGAGGSAGSRTEDSSGGIILTTFRGGTGGGMGEIQNHMNVKPDITASYNAIVGAAGVGAYSTYDTPTTAATAGGSTSFMGFTAAGGAVDGGGAGMYSPENSNGTPAQPGQDNTTLVLNDDAMPLVGGAGGGSGNRKSGVLSPGAAGGRPGGGAGATILYQQIYQGNPGTAPGAGGGGGYHNNNNQPDQNAKVGGDGVDGAIYYRWRVA